MSNPHLPHSAQVSAYTPAERQAWWSHLLTALSDPDPAKPYVPWMPTPRATVTTEAVAPRPLTRVVLFPVERTRRSIEDSLPCCSPDTPWLSPVPKELPHEQRRSEYVHVRLTRGELARLDAHIARLNKRGGGDGADVKRASWVRKLVLRTLSKAEERLQNEESGADTPE